MNPEWRQDSFNNYRGDSRFEKSLPAKVHQQYRDCVKNEANIDKWQVPVTRRNFAEIRRNSDGNNLERPENGGSARIKEGMGEGDGYRVHVPRRQGRHERRYCCADIRTKRIGKYLPESQRPCPHEWDYQ